MIMFDTYMTQYTSSDHGILMRKKITTYLDSKGTSKNTCFLCEQLIQAKTPDFTRGRLYETVNCFPFNARLVVFTKTFIFNKLKRYPTAVGTTKYFENIMLLTLDIKHLNTHQATSVLGPIILNKLALNLTVNYRMNY